jgi:hypothetical protein
MPTVVVFPRGTSSVPALAEEALLAITQGKWTRFFKVRAWLRELEEGGPEYHGVTQAIVELAREVKG